MIMKLVTNTPKTAGGLGTFQAECPGTLYRLFHGWTGSTKFHIFKGEISSA
jgi:hypothetical protein